MPSSIESKFHLCSRAFHAGDDICRLPVLNTVAKVVYRVALVIFALAFLPITALVVIGDGIRTAIATRVKVIQERKNSQDDPVSPLIEDNELEMGHPVFPRFDRVTSHVESTQLCLLPTHTVERPQGMRFVRLKSLQDEAIPRPFIQCVFEAKLKKDVYKFCLRFRRCKKRALTVDTRLAVYHAPRMEECAIVPVLAKRATPVQAIVKYGASNVSVSTMREAIFTIVSKVLFPELSVVHLVIDVLPKTVDAKREDKIECTIEQVPSKTARVWKCCISMGLGLWKTASTYPGLRDDLYTSSMLSDRIVDLDEKKEVAIPKQEEKVEGHVPSKTARVWKCCVSMGLGLWKAISSIRYPGLSDDIYGIVK